MLLSGQVSAESTEPPTAAFVEWCDQWTQHTFLNRQPSTIAPTPCIKHWLQRNGVALRLLDQYLSVMWCESHFKVWAFGDSEQGGSRGLLQIYRGTARGLGVPDDKAHIAFDVDKNIQLALEIQERDMAAGYGRWASWSCRPNDKRFWELANLILWWGVVYE